ACYRATCSTRSCHENNFEARVSRSMFGIGRIDDGRRRSGQLAFYPFLRSAPCHERANGSFNASLIQCGVGYGGSCGVMENNLHCYPWVRSCDLPKFVECAFAVRLEPSFTKDISQRNDYPPLIARRAPYSRRG